LALAAEPVVQLLYGPNWAEVAPLLRWTALAEMFFVAIPLQMDIPILLGRIRTLVWVNLADTLLTLALLATFCLWGLEAAALSRIAIGAAWFVIYIGFIKRLLDIPLASLLGIYGKSAICAAIAGMPLALASYLGWGGADMGFVRLVGLSLAGGLCWLAALPLLRHPAWQEFRIAAARVPVLRTMLA
jgi:O-antigen/teichoic acid export membrane protein